MNATTKTNRIDEVKKLWAYVCENASDTAIHFPAGWIEEVRAEAIAFGIVRPSVGAACRPGIDARIVYGGDMEDVF